MLHIDIPIENLLNLNFHGFSLTDSNNDNEFWLNASLSAQSWMARARTYKHYIAIDFPSLIVG